MREGHKMLEIKSSDSTEINDNFDFKYVYIDNIYSLNSKDLPITDRNSYLQLECNYYDSTGAFESVIDLGKTFIQELRINSLKEIKKSVSKHPKTLHKLITKWLILNPFPYSLINFTSDDEGYKRFLELFVYDCIYCYIIYDIHKWLLKIYNNQDIISEAIKVSGELNELEKRLDFINFKESIETYAYYVPMENEIDIFQDKRKEYSNKLKLINKIANREKITIQDLKDYYNFIWNYITPAYPSYNLIDDANVIPILNKDMIYEPNINQYRQLEKATSIMDVAYIILNDFLTRRSSMRVICANPNCNNEFTPKTTQKFCKNPNCQKYRNNKKSNDYYHKPKEKGSSL